MDFLWVYTVWTKQLNEDYFLGNRLVRTHRKITYRCILHTSQFCTQHSNLQSLIIFRKSQIPVIFKNNPVVCFSFFAFPGLQHFQQVALLFRSQCFHRFSANSFTIWSICSSRSLSRSSLASAFCILGIVYCMNFSSTCNRSLDGSAVRFLCIWSRFLSINLENQLRRSWRVNKTTL